MAFDDQTEDFDALTEKVTALRIGKAPKEGRGWSLALDGEWVPLKVGTIGKGLWIERTPKNEPGVSGSAILAEDGTAVAVVCTGAVATGLWVGVRRQEKSGPHPILEHHLPGWLLQNPH